VEIAKTASEMVSRSGDVITYTITLNVPFGPANGVVVADVLPSHLNFVALGTVPAGGIGSWNVSTKTLTWTFPALAAGAYSFTYQAQVDNFVQQGTVLVNNAQVTYTGLAAPKTTAVTVTMATAYMVHLGVYNESGELVKEIWVQQLSQQITSFDIFQNPTITSLHGQIYIEYHGQQIATWDGTTQSGDPVTNGNYYVKVDNIDPYGVVNSVSETVAVNRSIAKVVVNVYNEAGEIVRHLFTYADDPNNLPLSDVNMSTNVIKPVAGATPVAGSSNSVSITSPNGLNLVWDGKSDTGAIVTSGHYEIEVHFTDGKGGEETFTRGIVVQGGIGSTVSGVVVASPNVLTNGQTTTTLTVNSTVSYTLTTNLYDVAGELIRKAIPGPGSNQATLDVSGLSSGIYLAVTELKDANGGLASKQMTKILIQH
jgi:uncharacterized repeat protein (TIGR01451 family)